MFNKIIVKFKLVMFTRKFKHIFMHVDNIVAELKHAKTDIKDIAKDVKNIKSK